VRDFYLNHPGVPKITIDFNIFRFLKFFKKLQPAPSLISSLSSSNRYLNSFKFISLQTSFIWAGHNPHYILHFIAVVTISINCFSCL